MEWLTTPAGRVARIATTTDWQERLGAWKVRWRFPVTISYGKEKPSNSGHDEIAWAKNRRDEFVITGR